MQPAIKAQESQEQEQPQLVAGTERGAGGGDAAQELEPQKEKRAQGTRASFSARLTGISRQKGHKNASFWLNKKKRGAAFLRHYGCD
jgi:hypothetical protein